MALKEATSAASFVHYLRIYWVNLDGNRVLKKGGVAHDSAVIINYIERKGGKNGQENTDISMQINLLCDKYWR